MWRVSCTSGLECVLCCRNASRRRQAIRQPPHCRPQLIIMDKARQVLARGVPPGVRRSYRTLADHGGVARSTLHRRDHDGPSDKDKADSQLYLKPWEESALVKFILHMSDLGQPVRIKYIPALAFVATRARPPADRPHKPPGKNWPKAFEKRHPETAVRRVVALDWNRHETNIAGKMVHWFATQGWTLFHLSILQLHILPDPTPIPTIDPRTNEHDGRYSDGIQSMFLPACWIHMLSELRPVPA
jgi:hypothetical protein